MMEYGFGFPLLLAGKKWIKYNLENKYQPNSSSKSLLFVAEDNMKVFARKVEEGDLSYWLLFTEENGEQVKQKKYSGLTCPGKLIRSYWRHICYLNTRDYSRTDIDAPSLSEL